jgi:hypothetical protein
MRKLLLLLFLCRAGALLHAQLNAKSIQWNEENIPVVHLSVNQMPVVQVEFADSVKAEPGDLILLDTLVNVQGTTGYSLSWSILKDQNYIPINNTIQITEYMTVYFLLSYHAGCTYADHITINEAVTGEIIKTASKIKIYPNPAREKIIVELTNAPIPVSLTLIDLMGVKVSEKEIEAGTDSPVIEFEVTNQLSGIYFIRLNTGKDIIVEKVLIIK